MPSRSVAELCSRYMTLDSARASLDEDIQRLQGKVVSQVEDVPAEGFDGEGASADIAPNGGASSPSDGLSSHESQGPAFDTLWMDLNDVLTQQAALISELADTTVINSAELHQKAVILGMLLQSAGSMEPLNLHLSRSIVCDITTLFP